MSTTRLSSLEFRRDWHEGMAHTIKQQMKKLRLELKMHNVAIFEVNEKIDILKQEE